MDKIKVTCFYCKKVFETYLLEVIDQLPVCRECKEKGISKK